MSETGQLVDPRALVAALPRMYRLALALTGNPHVAEDISHDILLKLWSVQSATDLSWPYVRAAVANAVHDHHRRTTDRLRILHTNAAALNSSGGPDEERDIDAAIDVRRALARLQDLHQSCAHLFRYHRRHDLQRHLHR